MLSFDLRTLEGLENHRGVGYMLFLASIIAPSLTAFALMERSSLAEHLLATVVAAGSVGLLATATCMLGSFLALFDSPGAPGGMASAGVRSLVLGISMSLIGQFAALGHALVNPRGGSFDAYARTALLICGSMFFALFVLSFYKQSAKNEPGSKDKSEDSGPGQHD